MGSSSSRTVVLLALASAALAAALAAWWAAQPAGDRDASESAAAEPEVDADPPRLELDAAAVGFEAAFPDGEGRAAVEVETASPADEAVAIEADAVRVRPRGTLVDASTRAPLPEYRLVLRDRAGKGAAMTTDAEGRFAATDALLTGPLRAHFSELQAREVYAPVAELRADPAPEAAGRSAPLELAVAAGPVYHLSIEPPGAPRPDQLGSNLRWKRPQGDNGASSASIHAGEPPWVRFGPVSEASESHGSLGLSSFDGTWSGRARVPLESSAVRVVLEAFAAIEARVVDPDGNPVEEAAVTLALPRADGSEDARNARTRRDGRFRFLFLPAGPATLRVRAQRFFDAEVPLALKPAESWSAGVELAREPDAGTISGLVLSDTGRYREDVWVRMVRPDVRDGPPPLACRVAWTEQGDAVTGSFELERVPPGQWLLSVAERDWFEWEPRRMEVSAPLSGFSLRVHDAVPVADLVVRTRAADGESPAAAFDLRLAGAGQRDRLHSEQGRLTIRSFPVEQPLRWRLDAPGCVPVVGDLGSFAHAESDGGRERRVCEVALEPGWGALVRVVNATGKRPIEGARVLLDGVEAGSTDTRGLALVRAAAQPGRVTVRWRDWNPVSRSARDLTRSLGSGLEATIELKAPSPKKKP